MSTVQAEPMRAANRQIGKINTLSLKERKAFAGNILKKASPMFNEELSAPSSWKMGTRGEPATKTENTPIDVSNTEVKKVSNIVMSTTFSSFPLSFSLYVPSTTVKNKKGKREYLPNLSERSYKKVIIEDATELSSGNKTAIDIPKITPIKYLIHIFIKLCAKGFFSVILLFYIFQPLLAPCFIRYNIDDEK